MFLFASGPSLPVQIPLLRGVLLQLEETSLRAGGPAGLRRSGAVVGEGGALPEAGPLRFGQQLPGTPNQGILRWENLGLEFFWEDGEEHENWMAWKIMEYNLWYHVYIMGRFVGYRHYSHTGHWLGGLWGMHPLEGLGCWGRGPSWCPNK